MYVVFLVGTGAWQRLVPTTWRILPDAWDSLLTTRTCAPSLMRLHPYDSLQQLGYFFIVFIAAPLMIVTGPVMSPAVVGRFPGTPRCSVDARPPAPAPDRHVHLPGLRRRPRGPGVHRARAHNLTHIVFGYYDPSRVGQAYVAVIATIIVVVALWIAMSLDADGRAAASGSCGTPRGDPPSRWDRFNFQQAAKRPWTEKDISKFHWVNTYLA